MDVIITGGDDGYMYIWDTTMIKAKFLVYSQDSPVLCINSLVDSNFLVTGGIEGEVKLWRLTVGNERNFEINLVKQFSLSCGGNVANPITI